MRVVTGMLLVFVLNALNTHDVSGLSSSLWTMPSNKLPLNNWSLLLQSYDMFPFQFEREISSICFENRQQRTEILSYFSEQSATLPQASLSCCFVANKETLQRRSDPLIQVQSLKLQLSKKQGPHSVHFDVLEPRGIFSDFYCSTIIDDFDSLLSRKTHYPSLSEIDALLGIGFKVLPDPIN